LSRCRQPASGSSVSRSVSTWSLTAPR